MKEQDKLYRSDVENAFTLRKLRLALKLDKESFAQSLGLNVVALEIYEDVRCPVPPSVIDKACEMAGLQQEDFTNGRIDQIFNKSEIGPAHLIPDTITPSALFDLLYAYELVIDRKGVDPAQVPDFLKMMVCGRLEPIEDKKRYGR